MATTSYTRARRHLKDLLDRVCDDHEPLVITRREGCNVVVVAEDDYSSLEETAYLLRSPANAEKLLAAIASDRAGEPGTELGDVLRELGLAADAEEGAA